MIVKATASPINSSTCASTNPVKDTALVVEGGGQRGIFTAGVLDSWLSKDFNPFALLIGASAGAQNLSSFIAKQPGHAKLSIMDLSSQPEFFNMKRSLLGGHAVDLDWYFNKVNDSAHELNINCALSQLKNRRLLFSATTATGLCPTLFEPKADSWMTMLKASSALPFLYKKGVRVGTDFYLDGGVTLPVPVQAAYELGAKKIVVIRTVPEHHNTQSPWVHKLKSWVCNENRCPKVLNIITRHETSYNDAVNFIESPPSDATIMEIVPPTMLASRILGSSDKALKANYQMGFEAGLTFLASSQRALL